MPQEWSAQPLNLLSPEVVASVRESLNEGIICGLHMFYAGGGGPEACAFSLLNSYLSAVEASRPGDWYTLWSVPSLDRQGALLLRKQSMPASESELKSIKGWLDSDQMREFVAVGCVQPKGLPEVCWGDFDSFGDLSNLADRCAASGEFAVLPLSDLLGSKLHLVDAKRPNENGEVPLGGPY
jgi:hypothetical protein